MKVAVLRKTIKNEANNQIVNIKAPPGFTNLRGALVIAVGSSTGLNTIDTVSSEKNLSIGFLGTNGFTTPANSQFCHLISTTDGAASIACNRGHVNTRFFRQINAGRAEFRGGSLSALDSDGFRYTNVGSATSVTQELLIVMFGGLGVSAAIGSSQLAQADAGDRTINGFSFQPDVILGSFVGTNPFNTTAAGDAIMSYGVSSRTSVKNIYSLWNSYTGGSQVELRAGIGTDMIFKRSSATGVGNPPNVSAASGGSVFQYNSDGFVVRTTNGAQAAATYAFNYMALKFDEPHATGYFFTPSGTGETFINTGFVPQCVIGASVGATLLGVHHITNNETTGITYWASVGPDDPNTFILGTGTITSSTGSATITGAGTSFWGQLTPGDKLYDVNYNSIGTFSAIASTTSATLTANASINVTAGNYHIKRNGHYSVFFGDENGAADSAAFCGVGETAPFVLTQTGGSITQLYAGHFVTLDGKPGFTVNYNTASANRLSWYLAIGAEARQRRRQDGST